MSRMERASIRMKGNVQMAGFRAFIKNAADSLNVKGFAENLEDGSLKVICEGKAEEIEELLNSIKENPPSFARIEGLDVIYEEYKGEFTGFERRGADVPREESESEMVALMRSFDAKGEVMIGILSSMNETLKGVKEDTGLIKQDTGLMLEKQDAMLEKQDTMLGKQDAMLEKQDLMLEKQDETTGEIRGLRHDLKAYMEERFDGIEREITEIKMKIGMA